MAVQFLSAQDQKRRQSTLDKAEAKWSGFKGYSPFESSAAQSPLGDLAKTVAVGYQADKWDKQLNKGKAGQVDETLAAAKLNGETAQKALQPDTPDQNALNGIEADEGNLYMELMNALNHRGSQYPKPY